MKKTDANLILSKYKWHLVNRKGESYPVEISQKSMITDALRRAKTMVKMDWSHYPQKVLNATGENWGEVSYSDKGGPSAYLSDKDGVIFAAVAVYEQDDDGSQEAILVFKECFSSWGF